jgi:hypothetical protein
MGGYPNPSPRIDILDRLLLDIKLTLHPTWRTPFLFYRRVWFFVIRSGEHLALWRNDFSLAAWISWKRMTYASSFMVYL